MEVFFFKASLVPVEARKPILFRRAALLGLNRKSKEPGKSLNIIFMGRREMRALNKKFLNHDYDTDVISFPYEKDFPTFGDVFVSVDQARKQAREMGHSLFEEIVTLIIHGTLHLRGYRDHTSAAKKKMFQEQDRLLRRITNATRTCV